MITSCTTSEFNNTREIERIDKLKYTKTTYEIETDSIESFSDTLTITKSKYIDNVKRYVEIINLKNIDRLITKSYYKENEDLFYEESKGLNGIFHSIFETKTNKEGDIYKAIQLDLSETNKYDTIYLRFKPIHTLSGKLQQLKIESETPEIGNFLSKIEYNENEKPIHETNFNNNVLIKEKVWKYKNSILQSYYYKIFNSNPKRIFESHFNSKGKLIKEIESEIYKNENKEIITKDYTYDNSDNLLRCSIYNKITKDIKSIKYIVIK